MAFPPASLLDTILGQRARRLKSSFANPQRNPMVDKVAFRCVSSNVLAERFRENAEGSANASPSGFRSPVYITGINNMSGVVRSEKGAMVILERRLDPVQGYSSMLSTARLP
jgi:hypothetical protein